MPNFSNNPPIDPRGHGLPLLRTPANGKLRLAITCTDLVGCPTHWWHGRTIPCEGDACEACWNGTPWRWHAYVSGLIATTRHHVLAEFTAQAAEHLVKYRESHGTLRYAILTAQRHKNLKNGRVKLTLETGDPERLQLPGEPDIIKCLSVIWNLPTAQMSVTDQTKNTPRIRINANGDTKSTSAAIATDQISNKPTK